ncbi:hypothetical protein [Moorena sp. SIO4A5]|uniref:hypothetical protein n=1 Tax=Moorena sp. SIO4A5 TaxID=2607838 RepID=UPI0013CBCE97|nr:hypothetical protein [Moorena sp. SIO4A5]NEO25301.1 hypothetical protein [Moorena sp. SIO4A5]
MQRGLGGFPHERLHQDNDFKSEMEWASCRGMGIWCGMGILPWHGHLVWNWHLASFNIFPGGQDAHPTHINSLIQQCLGFVTSKL